MAASSKICVRLFGHSYSSWKGVSSVIIQNRSVTVSGIRCYRGSNRDTRRREQNERTRQRKREGTKPMIFDQREFIRVNYDTELFAFKNRFSLGNMDNSVLKTALTHESYEQNDSENNSKLATIGCNLVTQYITEFLFFKYPAFPDKGIRCVLDFLTSRSLVVKVAESLALPELIRVECGLDTLEQEKHLNYTREDIICDAFYALIGAIYQDKGSAEANSFVMDFVLSQLQEEELQRLLKFKDPEMVLNDILLSEGKQKADPRIIRESGKMTNLPVFVIGVFSGDIMLGEAASYNLTNAKHEAFLSALMNVLQHDAKHEPTLPSDQNNMKLHSYL